MVRLLLVLVLVSGISAAVQADGLDFARQAQQAESRQEFELATNLYTKAIESGDLNPGQLADALRYRGNANFFRDRFDAAAGDYTNSLKRNPADLYAALWLYMTREFTGQDGRPELIRATKQTDLFYWPGPVVNLFLGQITPEEILEAAKDVFLDEKAQNEQACEAYFYAGQYAMLNGDKSTAIRLFRAAIDTGVTSFIEYEASRLALDRLGG
ncbi:MAG: hypothetical protein ACTSW2_04360 [Alphaproteobacteria bacterium]